MSRDIYYNRLKEKMMEEIVYIPPDEDSVSIVREIVKQNTLILKALLNPPMVINEVKGEK